jgi:hypothetical protein
MIRLKFYLRNLRWHKVKLPILVRARVIVLSVIQIDGKFKEVININILPSLELV